MIIDDLKKILDGTGAIVKSAGVHDKGQDPFVLYVRQYSLVTKSFTTNEQIREFFAGKKIVACDCFDSHMFRNVRFWIHDVKVEHKKEDKQNDNKS